VRESVEKRDLAAVCCWHELLCAKERDREKEREQERKRVCACVRARQLFTLVHERAHEQEREIVCVRVCVRDLAADSIIFTTVRERESEWSRKQMCVRVRAAQMSPLLASPLQGGEDPQDALSRGSLSANKPLITGLFCRKLPIQIRHPMSLCHPVPYCTRDSASG